MQGKQAKTPAERKRAQREREKPLKMAELRLDLAATERDWIEQGAMAAGYEDRTEYLLDLVRHDLEKTQNVTGHVFGVMAGKYEAGAPNCKYSEDFPTLAQAITAADRVAGYPWVLIEYSGRFFELKGYGFRPFA